MTKETRRHAAVDGKRATDDWMVPPEDIYIERDRKAPLYDPRVELPVLPEQVDVFRAQGQTKAITVRKNGEALEVMGGLQTLKTAMAFNAERKKEKLPPVLVRITLRKAPTDTAFLLFREADNLRRASLPSMLAHSLYEHHTQGVPVETSILYLGLDSPSHAKQLLAFYELHQNVKQAVDDGRLSLSRAVKRFKALSLEDQKKQLPGVIEGRDTTVHAPTKLKTGRPSITLIRNLWGNSQSLTQDQRNILNWIVNGGDPDEIVGKGTSKLLEVAEGGDAIESEDADAGDDDA